LKIRSFKGANEEGVWILFRRSNW